MRSCLLPILFLASSSVWSQTPAQYIRIQTQHIKSGNNTEFIEVRRQIKAAYEKANRKDSVLIYRDVGNGDYRIVTFMDKLAGLDQRPGLRQLPEGQGASFASRIASYSTGSESKVYRSYGELSVSVGDTPKYSRLQTYHVRPGNMQKLVDLYKEALPGAKNAGLKRLRVSRLIVGGDFDELRVTSGFDKFADLDQPSPFAKSMGDKYQQWVQRLTALISHSEVRVGEFLPNLSHVVPAR